MANGVQRLTADLTRREAQTALPTPRTCNLDACKPSTLQGGAQAHLCVSVRQGRGQLPRSRFNIARHLQPTCKNKQTHTTEAHAHLLVSIRQGGGQNAILFGVERRARLNEPIVYSPFCQRLPGPRPAAAPPPLTPPRRRPPARWRQPPPSRPQWLRPRPRRRAVWRPAMRKEHREPVSAAGTTINWSSSSMIFPYDPP